MVSEFFIDIILPIALWPWGQLNLQQKWVPGGFPGGKCGRCVRLTLPHSCAVVMKSGNLNFLEPSGPLQACNGTELPLSLLYMKTDIHDWSYLAQFLLEWEMFQTKDVEKIKTHFAFSNFFFSENRAVCEIMWKNNILERGRPQVTIRHMRILCWIPKATDTHSEYAIFIAYTLQQWLPQTSQCYVILTLPVLLLLLLLPSLEYQQPLSTNNRISPELARHSRGWHRRRCLYDPRVSHMIIFVLKVDSVWSQYINLFNHVVHRTCNSNLYLGNA